MFTKTTSPSVSEKTLKSLVWIAIALFLPLFSFSQSPTPVQPFGPIHDTFIKAWPPSEHPVRISEAPAKTLSSESKAIPGPDCDLPACNVLVAYVVEQYQPIVDATCQSMTIPIECCDQFGFSTYLMILVTPSSGCSSTDPVSKSSKN